MTGRCATCRWWNDSWGEGMARWCTLTRVTRGWEDKEFAWSLAHASAHYDECVLVTAPDFGCVQWEERPHEEADALKAQGGSA